MVAFNDGGEALVGGEATANGVNRKAFYKGSVAPSFVVDGVTFPESGTLWLDTSTDAPTPKIRDNAAAAWREFVMTEHNQTIDGQKTLNSFLGTLTGTLNATGQEITAPRLRSPYAEFVSRIPVPLLPSLSNPFAASKAANGTATVTQGSDNLSLATGSTSSSEAAVVFRASAISGQRSFELGLLFDISDTTNVEFEVGVTTSPAGTSARLSNATDRHITLRFNSATSANWIVANANGTTETTTTTGTAVTANTKHYLVIIYRESSALVYLDGTLLATHTTNLPADSTAMGVSAFVNNTAASSRTVNVYQGYLVVDYA